MLQNTIIKSKNVEVHLHNFYENVLNRLEKLKSEDILKRILTHDYTIWSDNPKEISDRLGWLDSPEKTKTELHSLNNFVTEIINNGFSEAVLLGMGGSSLAPEVFSKSFGTKKGYLHLSILDSTHPEVILNYEKKFDSQKTLYIVSTKSGSTIETISFMKYFFNLVSQKLGKEKAPKHFIAITDPGSGLEEIAKKLNFRKIFLNDPNIGGRYSALSLFGIVPAALLGIDVKKLLNNAQLSFNSLSEENVHNIPSAVLGAAIAELAVKGVDKLTFIISKEIESFGSWLEQLIAESLGKSGKGILPVDQESVLPPEFYSADRLFVNIKLKGDNSNEQQIKLLEEAKHPLIKIELNDIYELGEQFFCWEVATSIMGWVLGINPFDQPNVEAAKVSARKMMRQFEEKGELPLLEISVKENDIEVIASQKYKTIKEAFSNFFMNFNDSSSLGRSYIAIHAYLNPTNQVISSLQSLRTALQKKYKSAVTIGIGPRFLHSTGQLHKGDGGKGLFIQFTSNIYHDVPIPEKAGYNDSSFSFGTLISAQSLGDREALLDKNRNVIRVNFTQDPVSGINKLTSLFS
ncbi:glucose-6-phosphate isomerase [Melioribacteraceae bacterium 4301-Me]|uniref:glucose-6-phosphate isomerase n=1 Tax=Pyranulibacter aquaticus TaxID=3163344 RepID=UPI00359B82C5